MTRKKVKILFTIPNFTTAGSGREMMNIIDNIDTDYFEPYICVEHKGGALFDEAEKKGYQLITHQHMVHERTGMLAIIQEARNLAIFFKKYKFDIWQSFNWSSDFSEALVAKFSGAKYVYVKKNMNWDRAAWKVKSFLSNKIVARNTTMFRRFFAPPYLKRKTHFIPGGVDVNKFYTISNSEFRSKYDVPEDKFLLTCVAQLVRVKDQLTLIKAIANLKEVYLVLAGACKDDSYVADIYSQIKELKLENSVLLTGAVSNVNDLLNASHVFVLPTTDVGGHEEGSPVALIEAMAAGVPCIASNVSGNRDLIQTDVTGLLFKPGNVEELRACILKYIEDKEYGKKMAENARQLILSENTIEIEADAFNTLYKRMMRIKTR